MIQPAESVGGCLVNLQRKCGRTLEGKPASSVQILANKSRLKLMMWGYTINKLTLESQNGVNPRSAPSLLMSDLLGLLTKHQQHIHTIDAATL